MVVEHTAKCNGLPTLWAAAQAVCQQRLVYAGTAQGVAARRGDRPHTDD